MNKARVVMGERWVICPVCGNKLMKARVADIDQTCKVCGNVITICATRSFVTTIVHDEEDENVSFAERMIMYQKELAQLTH